MAPPAPVLAGGIAHLRPSIALLAPPLAPRPSPKVAYAILLVTTSRRGSGWLCIKLVARLPRGFLPLLPPGFDFAQSPPPCDHKVPGLAFGAAGLEKFGP
jgi:hypothetical protein